MSKGENVCEQRIGKTLEESFKSQQTMCVREYLEDPIRLKEYVDWRLNEGTKDTDIEDQFTQEHIKWFGELLKSEFEVCLKLNETIGLDLYKELISYPEFVTYLQEFSSHFESNDELQPIGSTGSDSED